MISLNFHRVLKWWHHKNQISEIMGFVRIFWNNSVQEAYLPKISISRQFFSEILAQLFSDNSKTLLNFFGVDRMLVFGRCSFRVSDKSHNFRNLINFYDVTLKNSIIVQQRWQFMCPLSSLTWVTTSMSKVNFWKEEFLCECWKCHVHSITWCNGILKNFQHKYNEVLTFFCRFHCWCWWKLVCSHWCVGGG